MVLAVYQLKRRGAIISLVNIIPGNINSDHQAEKFIFQQKLPLRVRPLRLSGQIKEVGDAIPGLARKPSNFHRLSA
jgi:hypothetical protein